MMLGRQCSRLLARSGLGRPSFLARAFADAAVDSPPPVVSEELKKAFRKVAPTLDFPKTPTNFLKPRPDVPSAFPSKITVNFSLPYSIELNGKEVDMIMVPATSGQMGILPGHVPTIAELKPGLLSVHDGSEVTKYFISGGFAIIHANSVTDVTVIEAAPLDHFDPEEVKKGLAEYTQKVNSASTDLEKAEAQIGLELHSALSYALAL